jgi:large subunit ribosomal protein L4
MATIAVHNLEGKKLEDMELSDDVFALKANNDLLHQVYVAISANQRFSIAHTKGKGERSGSGKKPFKQKGTGSARQGQKRNPIMRGGGISFGPTSDRNFSKDINKKMKQKAVKIALSEKVRAKTLIVVDELKLKESKTKEFAQAIKNLKLTGKILIGFDQAEKGLQLASRNLPKVENMLTKDLNVFDMLNNKYVLISKSSVQYLEEKFKK